MYMRVIQSCITFGKQCDNDVITKIVPASNGMGKREFQYVKNGIVQPEEKTDVQMDLKRLENGQ